VALVAPQLTAGPRCTGEQGWRQRNGEWGGAVYWGDTGLLLDEVLARIGSSRWPVHTGAVSEIGGRGCYGKMAVQHGGLAGTATGCASVGTHT
jgi:hypothetical protein